MHVKRWENTTWLIVMITQRTGIFEYVIIPILLVMIVLFFLHGTLHYQSSVVASGMAEEAGHKISFGEYFKVSFPLMLVTLLIATVYLVLRYLI